MEKETNSRMKLRFLISRSPLQFSLQALFILFTVPAIWLGYHANWIHQRREGRKWIEQHPFNGEYGMYLVYERPDLPWALKLFGEKPLGGMSLRSCLVAPKRDEDLTEYKKQLARMEALFPECQIEDAGFNR